LQIVPDGDGFIAHDAIEGGGDAGMAEVQLGLLHARGGLREAGGCLGEGGVQHIHLAIGAEQGGLVRCERSAGCGEVGIGLIGGLDRAGTGRGEFLVAPLVLFGKGEARCIALDCGLRAGDFGLLKGEFGLVVGDGGLRRLRVRFGGGKCGLVVAGVNGGEQVALMDRLVVSIQRREGVESCISDNGIPHALELGDTC
jgi:hypothetical protein